MRKLSFVIPLLAVVALGCSSKPPVGPGVVTITETTTSTSTSTTTTSTIAAPTVSLFQFSPVTPQALETVFFDGSLSTPGSDRTIVSYNWDFGDGTLKSGIKQTHDFVVSGVYLVTLFVTDDSGKVARSSQPVTVRPVIP
jgi:PKD repeat protein